MRSRATLLELFMIHVFAGWLYGDKGEVLVDSLRRHGFDATLETSVPVRRRFRRRGRDELWIGHFTHYSAGDLPERYVAIQSEPMWIADAWWSMQPHYLPMVSGALEVWDYHEADRPIIERLGRRFTHVPCGYSPLHERWHADALSTIEKPDIDVLFVGGMNPRRTQAIESLVASGLRVEVVTYDAVVHGAPLHRLIARSKLSLQMHRSEIPEDHGIDLFRFDHVLANGVPVLHERVTPRSPFDAQFMDRIPFFDLPDIVSAVHSRLGDLDTSRQEARDTQEWFKQEIAFDQYVPFDRIQGLLDAR